MNEIYWITRLGNISSIAEVILVISIIIMTVLLIIFYIECFNDENLLKWIKRVGICAAVSIVAVVFIPSKKDMLLIYGIGGAIDYIKSNDAAGKIPDKCMIALDKLIDEYINEQPKKE